MAAAREAQDRVGRLAREQKSSDQEAISFGLGLHVGGMMYGNIGVPERLEFSVIGPAANEVARPENLTKEYDGYVLVSAEFAQHLPVAWESLGLHELRVVGLSGMGAIARYLGDELRCLTDTDLTQSAIP